ncbi:MAG: helix-turn-helix transcriptional regulator [Clostridia bacterium]|nr:helix-turn-helix transcriptional regulator [Clostridia bacterium]
MEIKNIIAKNIAELRKANDYTQSDLASKLNYSDKSVSKWERAEAIPDVAVLKEIADLFGVSLDYMVEEKHKIKTKDKISAFTKLHNHGFITGMSILLVWLLAMLGFIITDSIIEDFKFQWLAFVYAMPITFIVWLVFNSIWFNKRRNFLIISFLMWSLLLTAFITLLVFSINLPKIFALGILGQIIIILWSRLKFKKENREENNEL